MYRSRVSGSDGRFMRLMMSSGDMEGGGVLGWRVWKKTGC